MKFDLQKTLLSLVISTLQIGAISPHHAERSAQVSGVSQFLAYMDNNLFDSNVYYYQITQNGTQNITLVQTMPFPSNWQFGEPDSYPGIRLAYNYEMSALEIPSNLGFHYQITNFGEGSSFVIYNQVTNGFYKVGVSNPSARFIPNVGTLILGGYNGTMGGEQNLVQVITPTSNWNVQKSDDLTLQPYPKKIYETTSVASGEKLYVMGGVTSEGIQTDVCLLDLTSVKSLAEAKARSWEVLAQLEVGATSGEAQIWNNQIIYIGGNFNVVQSIHIDTHQVKAYPDVLDQQAWNRVSYVYNDRMVIFNGYPTSPNCGQQSQNLNVIGQSWADNCVGNADMPFQFIDDDCSYYNIIL